MFVPVCTVRMHIEGLWCVSVSEPSKGRGSAERSSNSSSIARVCVRVCERMCEGWRGEERQTRQDSREREREFGPLSSTAGEPGPKDEARSVAQSGASGTGDVQRIAVRLWRGLLLEPKLRMCLTKSGLQMDLTDPHRKGSSVVLLTDAYFFFYLD